MSSMPADIAAERGVLACICKFNKDAFLEVSDFVKSTTFSYHLNQTLYAVLSHVLSVDLDKKIDLAIILSAAKDLGVSNQLLSDGKYLDKILNFNVELSNLRGFASKIRKLEITRQIIGRYSDAQGDLKKITGVETISEIITKAETPIFELINNLTEKTDLQHVSDGLDEYVEQLKTGSMDMLGGIDIGCPLYQSLVGGITPGIHLISARKKTGKSFDAMNKALYSSKTGIPTFNCDSEMKKDTGWWARALSRISGVNLNDIRYGVFRKDEVKVRKIEQAQQRLKQLPLYYETISNREFNETVSLIKRWLLQVVGFASDGNLNRCLVVYDWLKLTDQTDLKIASEFQLLGFRTTILNDLALKYKFPILLYTQQNREMDIAASDRLSWYSTSCAALSKKTQEEINTDGQDCGNLKLVVTDARNAEGTDYGDYLNIHLNGRVARVNELGLNSVMQKMKEPEGE